MVILTTVLAVCGAARLQKRFLRPASYGGGGLLNPFGGLGHKSTIPAGGYANDDLGVVVDVVAPGTRTSGIEPTGLGGPRIGYGSKDSKVGDAAFNFGGAAAKVPTFGLGSMGDADAKLSSGYGLGLRGSGASPNLDLGGPGAGTLGLGGIKGGHGYGIAPGAGLGTGLGYGSSPSASSSLGLGGIKGGYGTGLGLGGGSGSPGYGLNSGASPSLGLDGGTGGLGYGVKPGGGLDFGLGGSKGLDYGTGSPVGLSGNSGSLHYGIGSVDDTASLGARGSKVTTEVSSVAATAKVESKKVLTAKSEDSIEINKYTTIITKDSDIAVESKGVSVDSLKTDIAYSNNDKEVKGSSAETLTTPSPKINEIPAYFGVNIEKEVAAAGEDGANASKINKELNYAGKKDEIITSSVSNIIIKEVINSDKTTKDTSSLTLESTKIPEPDVQTQAQVSVAKNVETDLKDKTDSLEILGQDKIENTKSKLDISSQSIQQDIVLQKTETINAKEDKIVKPNVSTSDDSKGLYDAEKINKELNYGGKKDEIVTSSVSNIKEVINSDTTVKDTSSLTLETTNVPEPEVQTQAPVSINKNIKTDLKDKTDSLEKHDILGEDKIENTKSKLDISSQSIKKDTVYQNSETTNVKEVKLNDSQSLTSTIASTRGDSRVSDIQEPHSTDPLPQLPAQKRKEIVQTNFDQVNIQVTTPQSLQTTDNKSVVKEQVIITTDVKLSDTSKNAESKPLQSQLDQKVETIKTQTETSSSLNEKPMNILRTNLETEKDKVSWDSLVEQDKPILSDTFSSIDSKPKLENTGSSELQTEVSPNGGKSTGSSESRSFDSSLSEKPQLCNCDIISKEHTDHIGKTTKFEQKPSNVQTSSTQTVEKEKQSSQDNLGTYQSIFQKTEITGLKNPAIILIKQPYDSSIQGSYMYQPANILILQQLQTLPDFFTLAHSLFDQTVTRLEKPCVQKAEDFKGPGEDFSGPKNVPSYDETGYHY